MRPQIRCELPRRRYRGIYSAEQWDPSTEPRDFEAIADWMIEHIRANIS